MSRLATSFVLGYHGCDKAVAEQVVNGQASLNASNRDFDWLGPGVYFWESDPQRAMEWAVWRKDRGDYETPCVIGAVIDLRNCLDLTNRSDLELLGDAYASYTAEQELAGLRLPENKAVAGDPNEDRLLRFLDCAVIRHLHYIVEQQAGRENAPDAFDTVRGMFTEGGDLYSGAGFKQKSHTQISVRTPACIKGVFYPIE